MKLQANRGVQRDTEKAERRSIDIVFICESIGEKLL